MLPPEMDGAYSFWVPGAWHGVGLTGGKGVVGAPLPWAAWGLSSKQREERASPWEQGDWRQGLVPRPRKGLRTRSRTLEQGSVQVAAPPAFRGPGESFPQPRGTPGSHTRRV